MSPGPGFVRRYLGWAIMLALLPLGVLLALLVTAYTLGLRIQGPAWQDGLELAQWQWWQGGCVKAQGEGLRVSGWRPLTISMTRMSLPTCDSGAEAPTALPWTPAFELSIDALAIPGLPPLALLIRQHEQRWQAQAQHRLSTAAADYERASGRWTLQGQIQAADIAPEYLGALTFTGRGIWQADRLEGALQAQGQQLGYRGQPQRADTTLEASLAAGQWQLHAALGVPLLLGGGWSLEARQALRASGNLDGIESLNLDLRAAGPQGSVLLTLDTEGVGLARGQGRLTLAGPALAGSVPLRWDRQRLELAPAAIQLAEELRLSWTRPLALPLALAGEGTITAELQYQDLRVKTVDSRLSWQRAEWGWQGRLDLAGNAAGHELAGFWQGRIDAAGLAGEPASLTINGPDLALALRLPVSDLRAPGWATRAEFSGHYGDYPLAGQLDASYAQGHWQGRVEGRSRPPFYAQGGGLKLSAPWYGKEGQWFLGADSRLTIAEGLSGTTLIKPITVAASTPLRLSPEGIFGTLQLKAAGLVAARWVLPPVSGQVAVDGRQGQAGLRVPAWQSKLSLSAELASGGKETGAQGTLEISTPLSAAMSRGLGVTLQKGQLDGRARWQWRERWRLQGDMTVSGLALDWGGILASGGNGAAHIELHEEGGALTSLGLITLAELDLGTPLRNARLRLQSDLATWHFADVYAEVLGGTMRAPSLQWPAPQYQPVTVSGIDLAEVAALQNDPNPTVQLAGRVGGYLPLQLMKDSLAVRGGHISNEGPLSLKVLPSAGVSAMGQSNRAVQLALDTLNDLAIHDFQARLDMQADGWLDAAVTIKGQNPQQNNLPVVLNYTHRENVLELLRSLRIGDEISQSVLERRPAQDSRPHDAEDSP